MDGRSRGMQNERHYADRFAKQYNPANHDGEQIRIGYASAKVRTDDRPSLGDQEMENPYLPSFPTIFSQTRNIADFPPIPTFPHFRSLRFDQK